MQSKTFITILENAKEAGTFTCKDCGVEYDAVYVCPVTGFEWPNNDIRCEKCDAARDEYYRSLDPAQI